MGVKMLLEDLKHSLTNLNNALGSPIGSGPCNALMQAVLYSDDYLADQGNHQLYVDPETNLVLTAFNSNPSANPPPSWETEIGSLGCKNVFYGVPFSQALYVPSVYGMPIPPRPRPIHRRHPVRHAQ